MNCKNCGTEFDSKFCPNCGQKADIHRITLGHVLHDFIHAFTHADKGFLLTIKSLLRYPGTVTREYLDGKRKKYFNPLSFLMITVALSAYLSYESGYFEAFKTRPPQSSNQSVEKKQPPVDIQKLDIWSRVRYEGFMTVIKHGKMIGLILITPLIAVLTWLFFRKPKHNYAEHFVLASYLFGLANVFRVVIFIPVFVLSGWDVNIIDNVFQIVFFIYLVVAFKQFFQQHILLTILKTVLVFILFIVLFWVLIFGFVYIKVVVLSLFG